jgi:CheY-like chemotaxis protein
MLERLGISKKGKVAREPAQTDVQQILAYLEELARLRTLVHLHLDGEAGLCLGARVEQVSEDAQRFVLSFPHQVPRLDPGAEVELHFPLAGMRFKAPITFLSRGDYMQSAFHLPARILFADRRMAMRTRIGSREKASAALFEGLSEGLAASGRLINLSMEGLCLRLDRALHQDGDRRVVPQADLFHEGQRLQLVRILNLPHLPTLECTGEVRYSRTSQGGPILIGIRFEALGGFESQCLHQFMARRLPSFARAFPVRRRKGMEGEEEAGMDDPDILDAAEEDEGPDASADAAGGDLDASGGSPEDRLVRLRRRGKRFLVIIPDDLDRSIFICTMGVGGYPCAFEARSLVQGLDHAKKTRFDALFLDEQIGTLTGLEVARRLRKLGHLEEVPTFLFAKSPDVRLTLAAKAAGVAHVIRQPVDFDGELKGLLDATFGLHEQ